MNLLPRHAGVGGNELADRVASTADITSGLQLGRAEMLGGLRNFLNMDRLEHHSIDHLKEKGAEKASRCQILLQMMSNIISIMASAPAWSSSDGMLSAPADLPFFSDFTAASASSRRIG